MTRKRIKKQQQPKKGVDTPVLKEIKVSNERPKSEIGDGHEDFPYQKGTMQDVGREFADEFGIMALPTKKVTLPQFVAISIVVGLLTYGVFVAISPLV